MLHKNATPKPTQGKEFIFIKYEGNNNGWGKVEYESAYKMFKTLNIIDKY